MPATTLLIVEDNHALAVALASTAESCGLKTHLAPTLAIARNTLNQRRIDGLLLDIGLPDGHGLELIELWKWARKPDIAVITAHGEIENAIAARKLGIARFFDKPVDFDALQEFFKSILPPQANTSKTSPPQSSFIGSSPVMRPVVHQISHTCTSEQPVVISGAPGTGKTHVAQTIQQSSQKKSTENSLQASALLTPSHLIEKIESSKNKSLIIESIHSLPMDLQELLAQTIDHLGPSAPRLIVTTDEKGLTVRLNQGDFNRDLFFRLQVLEIKLPPLKTRADDIRAIAINFLKESGAPDSLHIDETTFSTLLQYPWPGNLRELRNAVNHAVVTGAASATISGQHLPSYITQPSAPRKIAPYDFSSALESWINQELSAETKYKELSAQLESELLQILLTRFDGKPSRLAAELSINRSTLRKKLNAIPPA